MKSIFAAAIAIVATASTQQFVKAESASALDVIVQQGHEHIPRVWEALKSQASKIPVTKREAIEKASIDPKTGKRFIMTFPADMHR